MRNKKRQRRHRLRQSNLALLAKRNLRCSRTEWYGEHLGPAAATVRSTHGMK